MKTKLPLYLAVLLLTQCSKCKNNPAPADPARQLPPATQTGVGTFGCLVNGQPLIPQGNTGSSNFDVVYDPGFRGGDLNIGAYRIADGRRQYFSISAAPVTGTGVYSFTRPTGVCTATYTAIPGTPTGCSAVTSDQDVTYRSGYLEITKFDFRNRIVSGTFSFTLLQASCDTLKFTQGRFDATF